MAAPNNGGNWVTPYLEVEDGVRLFYETAGKGPPVVFVHEFAGSLRSWDEQVEAFQRRFRTVVYNCRGYPPSTVPDALGAYSLNRSIDDLERVMTLLGLERVALVGLSMGGSIALNFSLRYPERVSRLVIAAAGSGSDNRDDFARQFEAVAGRLEKEGTRPIADDYLTGPTRIQLQLKRPYVWRKLYDEFCALSPRGLANTIRGTILPRPPAYALKAKLRSLRVPTLVITGDEDGPTLGPSRFVAETIPKAKLLIFEKTGHTVNLEEPIRFNETVCGFLASSS